jgi:hypothetical protein
MSFDPTKPVQTRDGRPARILATDIDDKFGKIAAAFRSKDGSKEFVDVFDKDGRAMPGGTETAHDLVNVPKRTEWFVNLGDSYANLDGARSRWPDDFVVLRVTLEDDKFVSAEPVE